MKLKKSKKKAPGQTPQPQREAPVTKAPKVKPDNVQHREDFERLLDDSIAGIKK